ncbi:MAG: hypothetical protein ACRERE_11520 [Candidatus Entotheonellia bacterium]
MNAHAHGDDMQHEAQAPSGDPASGHGMAIIGEMTVFLSHLPMFMSPHDYQVILEVTLTNQGSDPQSVYTEDRRQHPDAKLYTFEPTRAFVLPDLFTPDPHHPPRLTSFQGNIYRGHFERFPTGQAKAQARIARDVIANVTNVVYARKFDPEAMDLEQLEYCLFGKGQELFMAHVITKPPDFDHLLSVQVAALQLTDEELRHGVPLKFPGRANTVENRINANDHKLSGVMEVAGKHVPVEIEPDVEFYFEAGELAAQM